MLQALKKNEKQLNEIGQEADDQIYLYSDRALCLDFLDVWP